MSEPEYQSFLKRTTNHAWEKIGVDKRAGVCVPLFSIHSSSSIGVGEFPDIKLLIDWCERTGISIIQLLPLNDVGFNFLPYDSDSSFAIDPMYLSLDEVINPKENNMGNQIEDLRKSYQSRNCVDYTVKGEKLRLLWQIYQSFDVENDKDFQLYRAMYSDWLEPYAIFKTFQFIHDNKSWEEWGEGTSWNDCKTNALNLKGDHIHTKIFHEWLQWLCYIQMRDVKNYADEKGVCIMGDLPFLVSRNSADVWANNEYFKLNQASGSPPDFFLVAGQRWGMPPYDWNAIKESGYKYPIMKMKYAENFYHLFRMDHAIGVFRIWSIPIEEPLESAGKVGRFDPPTEDEWEAQGRDVLEKLIRASNVLPCAEDLGTVPPCSEKILDEIGIPGMDIQRWKTNPPDYQELTLPENYRACGVTSISTHDMAPFASWWTGLDDVERLKFVEYYELDKGDAEDIQRVVLAALIQSLKANSVFCIQLIHDWLLLDRSLDVETLKKCVNEPGTFSDSNWSWRCPLSLEEMLNMNSNSEINSLIANSGRSKKSAI